MTRDKMIRGLNQALRMCACLKPPCTEADALRAAIALLTPPPTEEIEAAHHFVRDCQTFTGLQLTPGVLPCLHRALDTLAREPEMEATVEDLSKRLVSVGAWRDSLTREQHDKDAHTADRIAALEAQIARVREYALWLRRENVDVRVADALDAMLATDSGPVTNDALLTELRDLLKWVEEHKEPKGGDEPGPWNEGRWQFVRLVKWEIVRRLRLLDPALSADAGPASGEPA